MSDNDSNLICNNPICEKYNIAINKEDAILGAIGELCCPICSMPLVDLSKKQAQADEQKSKKMKTLIIAFAGLIIVCGLIYGGFSFFKNKTNVGSEPIVVADTTTIVDKEKAIISEERTNKSGNTSPKTSTDKESNKSLEFSFGYYKGEIKNGLRDGQGVMTFTEKYLISPKDLKKRYAEVGDYVSGTWVEGNIVNGKLFDKNGEQKETLLIGH
jgi:hypothetical protein